MRRSDCMKYQKCLDIAARKNDKKMRCDTCELYKLDPDADRIIRDSILSRINYNGISGLSGKIFLGTLFSIPESEAIDEFRFRNIQENITDISKDYVNGMPINKIAKKFKKSADSILDIIRADNVPVRKYDKIDKKTSEKIISMFWEGAKGIDIAKETGLSDKAVYSLLQRKGLTFKKREELRCLNGNT